MAKLYFKYGAMGSSKSAQALITKFNYEERGLKVWLIKPAIDTREGRNVCRSRIGLEAEVELIDFEQDIYKEFCENEQSNANVIIVDECQFLSEEQIDQLQDIVLDYDIPVLCFGLKSDFQTKLFPGSKRLFEIADSIQEIKTICSCGKKAAVNARVDENGNLITEGNQIEIGGNDRYIAMCHKCYKEKKKEQSKK
ncbi:MAG: thymidine kinase [bacterium]|nr:thymidine kinase [bacterium]